MPSSRPYAIPYVVSLITRLQPATILDVGVGFGKWGYLFREFTDVLQSESDPARYAKDNWRTRIEGIEAYEPYIHDAHRYIYDRIHIGDALEILPTLERYDVIFLGDIVEHFPMEAGRRLLKEATAHFNQCLMVTTPRYETHQSVLCGNELEQHHASWTPRDFRSIAPCRVYTPGRHTLLAVYWGSEMFPLEPRAKMGWRSMWVFRKLKALKRTIRERFLRRENPTKPGARDAGDGSSQQADG